MAMTLREAVEKFLYGKRPRGTRKELREALEAEDQVTIRVVGRQTYDYGWGNWHHCGDVAVSLDDSLHNLLGAIEAFEPNRNFEVYGIFVYAGEKFIVHFRELGFSDGKSCHPPKPTVEDWRGRGRGWRINIHRYPLAPETYYAPPGTLREAIATLVAIRKGFTPEPHFPAGKSKAMGVDTAMRQMVLVRVLLDTRGPGTYCDHLVTYYNVPFIPLSEACAQMGVSVVSEDEIPEGLKWTDIHLFNPDYFSKDAEVAHDGELLTVWEVKLGRSQPREIGQKGTYYRMKATGKVVKVVPIQ